MYATYHEIRKKLKISLASMTYDFFVKFLREKFTVAEDEMLFFKYRDPDDPSSILCISDMDDINSAFEDVEENNKPLEIILETRSVKGKYGGRLEDAKIGSSPVRMKNASSNVREHADGLNDEKGASSNLRRKAAPSDVRTYDAPSKRRKKLLKTDIRRHFCPQRMDSSASDKQVAIYDVTASGNKAAKVAPNNVTSCEVICGGVMDEKYHYLRNIKVTQRPSTFFKSLLIAGIVEMKLCRKHIKKGIELDFETYKVRY